MNQILYTGNKKSSKPASINSILKFFGISLLIIAAIFIGKAAFTLIKNNQIASEKANITIPKVSFKQEGNNAVVEISHDKGISKVKYKWPGEQEVIKQGNYAKSFIIDDISIPTGKNKLSVTVIDEGGHSSDSSYEYSYDGTSIQITQVEGENFVNIIASNLKGLAYVAYRWNSDEEFTVYPTGENNSVIEKKAEIPSGKNTLYVTAIDLANKTLTEDFDIYGITYPEVSVYLQGNDLIVSVSDEQGIKSIVQTIYIIENGQVAREKTDTIDPQKATTYRYLYEINDSENTIVKIDATDVDGYTRTYNGKNY